MSLQIYYVKKDICKIITQTSENKINLKESVKRTFWTVDISINTVNNTLLS